MDLGSRAVAHAALGDSRRLLIADHLALGDRTVAELGQLSGMRGNLLAHHLDVLEEAGLIERRVSEGDHRRRYVSLLGDRFPDAPRGLQRPIGEIAFICTHNSARSQFAAALWTESTGLPASSAGSQPSQRVHPKAVQVATEFGVDLSGTSPGGYDRLPSRPDLIVSVCDRAHESGRPPAESHLHWSVPDPVAIGTLDAFRSAFGEISQRIEHLSAQGENTG